MLHRSTFLPAGRRKRQRSGKAMGMEMLEERILMSAAQVTKAPNALAIAARLDRRAAGTHVHSADSISLPSTGGESNVSSTAVTSTAPASAASTTGQTVYADPRADLNGDGVVDLDDLSEVTNNWGRTGTPGTVPGDVNGDGVVDLQDLSIVTNNWGLSVAPPPAPPAPPVQYDWHEQTINGVLNIWAPNPSDFGTTFTVTDPKALFGPSGVPEIEAVDQGPIADCYFLSAAGSIANENPSRIESLVSNDSGGGWAVTFQYWDVLTSKYDPVVIHTDNELSYSQSLLPPDGEVWAMVLEKAYAAFRTWNGLTSVNTLASLNWGFGSLALSALGDANSSYTTVGQSNQAIYNTLQADLAANDPILFQTSPAAPTMVESHVYTITGVSTDASGQLWVTTYNPWGFYDTRTMSDLLANGTGAIVIGTA